MERGIIDPFHGQEDLEKKIVRAVGKAKDRFAEDALRMMRGIRFSAQLDFSLDEEAYLGIESLKESLENVSKERIAVELWKLLASAHPDKVEMFFSTGLAPYITEDFPKIQESGIPKLLPFAPVEKIVRFGLFLRNVPDLARKILRDLKLDRESIEGGSHFAALFSEEEVESPYALRKRIARYGLKMVRDFYEIRLALLQQDEEELYSPLEIDLLEAKRRTGEIIITKKQAESIVKERLLWITKVESEKNCVSLSELMLSGKDLISLGVSPGKRMGEILQLAFDRVLQEPKENEKEKLISYLQESGLLDS